MVVIIGNQMQVRKSVRFHLAKKKFFVQRKIGISDAFSWQELFINYFDKILSHEFLIIQDRFPPESRLWWVGYKIVHSYNILVITHVLGFTSDLGNN